MVRVGNSLATGSAPFAMSEQHMVKVKTTLPTSPLLPNSERKPIRTERLILRPFAEDDLDDIWTMRTQPEVMNFTATGRIEADKKETWAFMARSMPPNDLTSYNYVICLASTGELIGTGGARGVGLSGWPEIGYMFKREHWGNGYATEFLRSLVDNWRTLPRSEIELEVDGRSIDGAGEVPESLKAVIDENNLGSRRVLEKSGFREYIRWTEPDSREGITADVALVGFVLPLVSKKG
ncbi:acyl-CoA N-acyltransferase [Hypoxylon crocopeplum]|nr:acyl-CoA N-acyltransferase [Hypoxylon crocopeplum]